METLKNTNANAMMNGTNPSNMTTMLSLLKAADIHNYLNFDNTRLDTLDNGDDSTLEILRINLNYNLAELDAEGNIDYWEALLDIKDRLLDIKDRLLDIKDRLQKSIIQEFYNDEGSLIQQTDRGFFDTNIYGMPRISCFISDFGFYITIFTQA